MPNRAARMITTRLKPSMCPACGHELDAATSVFDKVRPTPGDVTVCINCAALLQFTDDLSFKLANTHELTLTVLDQLAEIQAAVRKMHCTKGPQSA